MSAFLTDLRAVFPKDRLYEDAARLAPYVSDGLTVFQETPLAVAMPINRDEVIEAVRICHRHGVPFVARGSGTSLSGGSLPIKEGLVISLNRLNRILSIDPVSRCAVVEPGVINARVSAEAAAYGLYFAPDPSSQSVCTIGGNLAFNSGGAHCLKYGMTSNHILGFTAVLPDGSLVELGNDSLENAGADCPGLFVGSEGLFGIALETKLRLLPIAEDCQTLLASYDCTEDAGDAVSAIVGCGILPAAIEIMDRMAIEAAEAAVNAGYPKGAQSLLIVELDGEKLDVAVQFEALRQVIAKTKPTEMRIAKDAAERALIWKGRKSAFSAVGRLSPDYLVQDGVVPRSKLGYALKEINRLGKESGLRVANVFHAGDGNLHPLILFNGKNHGELETAEKLAGQILRLCLQLGGSITGEHGVGVEKKMYMTEMFSPDTMDAFEALRQKIDPKEIANRGKVFPDRDPNQPRDRERFSEIREHIKGRDGSPSHPRTATDRSEIGPYLRSYNQITEYLPEEYTITVQAGATVRSVQERLAKEGQYLPFDPPHSETTTIGAMISRGLSGPGAYRFGLLRDFILGVGFIDGHGRYVQTGGKVVKNAAGFDLPKFFAGTHGCLGPIVDASFKVFPKPAAYRTARYRFPSLPSGLAKLIALARSRFALDSLELAQSGELLVRIGGEERALDARIETLSQFLSATPYPIDQTAESAFWSDLANCRDLPASGLLAKIPITPTRVIELNTKLASLDAAARFGLGGSIAWIQTDRPAEELSAALAALKLEAQIIRGDSPAIVIGHSPQQAFYRRVKTAFDPRNVFTELY